MSGHPGERVDHWSGAGLYCVFSTQGENGDQLDQRGNSIGLKVKLCTKELVTKTRGFAT